MKKNFIYLFNISLSFFVIFFIYFLINFFHEKFFSIQKYQYIIQFLLELNFLGYFYVVLFEFLILIVAFPTTPLLVVNKILFQEYNIILSLLIMVLSSTTIYFVFNKIKILNLFGKKLIKKKKIKLSTNKSYFYIFISRLFLPFHIHSVLSGIINLNFKMYLILTSIADLIVIIFLNILEI
jgi:hypothetical protein